MRSKILFAPWIPAGNSCMTPQSFDHLSDALIRAAETERALPAALQKQKLTFWPDHINEWHEYGWRDATAKLARPSPADIDELDSLYVATSLLDESESKLVWAVAHSAAYRSRGPAWRKIGRKLGIDPRTVKTTYTRTIERWFYRIIHAKLQQ